MKKTESKKDAKFDMELTDVVLLDIEGYDEPVMAHAMSFLQGKKWMQRAVENILSQYRKEHLDQKVLLDNFRRRFNRFVVADDKNFVESIAHVEFVEAEKPVKKPRARRTK